MAGVQLSWAIRASFQTYVRDVEGTIELIAPASRRDGAFVFPGKHSPTALMRFEGGVSFRAHEGVLAVDIVEPWLEMIDGERTLTALTALGDSAERVAIVCLEPQVPEVDFPATARLTAPGARLFGGVYRPGDLLDPVQVRTN